MRRVLYLIQVIFPALSADSGHGDISLVTYFQIHNFVSILAHILIAATTNCSGVADRIWEGVVAAPACFYRFLGSLGTIVGAVILHRTLKIVWERKVYELEVGGLKP